MACIDSNHLKKYIPVFLLLALYIPHSSCDFFCTLPSPISLSLAPSSPSSPPSPPIRLRPFYRPNGALTEKELRSNPAYHSYYYSYVNLNPRLPPPLLSKEDRGSSQRFKAGRRGLGGIGDGRRSKIVGNGVEKQLGFDSEKWLDKEGNGLIGLPGIVLGRHNVVG